jgi:hypothetical protein
MMAQRDKEALERRREITKMVASENKGLEIMRAKRMEIEKDSHKIAHKQTIQKLEKYAENKV